MAGHPIDSFVKYFLDIKPYHTKILEIIEQYLFSEEFSVSIKENIYFEEEWANDPLCKGVGYGLDFDDDCGYSAISCCDLFDCVGGYGLIYDNSDVLVELPIVDHDNVQPFVTVTGDWRHDKHYQIDSILSNNIIRIFGNYVSEISNHSLFLIKKSKTFNIIETLSDGVIVSGNYKEFFDLLDEVSIIESINSGRYSVLNSVFDGINTVLKFRNITNLNISELGKLITNSANKNNGLYKRQTIQFDGTYTLIQLHDSSLIPMVGETDHGSVVIRTAFTQNRRIFLTNAETTLVRYTRL